MRESSKTLKKKEFVQYRAFTVSTTTGTVLSISQSSLNDFFGEAGEIFLLAEIYGTPVEDHNAHEVCFIIADR